LSNLNKNMYRIDLEMFEGPLDLMLFLIKKDEINIYDIPIAKITKDFLQYVELAKEMKLSKAGDFVLMAATLMKIKVRMLLPVEESDNENIEDPRTDLVNMLLEYKRFKEISQELEEKEKLQGQHYYRIPLESGNVDITASESLEDVQMYDLMVTFRYLLQNYEEPLSHNVYLEKVSIADQMIFLKQKLMLSKTVKFSELIPLLQSRLVLVITFLAILDLVKGNQIKIKQSQLFDELLVMKGEKFEF
jgi:segregation and condensation protein A